MVKAQRAVLWGLVVGIAVCLGAGGAELPANVVYWSPDRPLTWSDFQAAPPGGTEQTVVMGGQTVTLIHAASPYFVFQWQAPSKAVGDGVSATALVTQVVVVNALDPSRSWVVAAHATDGVLHHEQLHFDLQEVYRRLLEMSLRSLTLTQKGSAENCKQAFSALLRSTADAILARRDAAQAAFEVETANGQNAEAQADWENRIAYYLLNPAAAP